MKTKLSILSALFVSLQCLPAAVIYDDQDVVIGLISPDLSGPFFVEFDVNHDGDIDFGIRSVPNLDGGTISVRSDPNTTKFIYQTLNFFYSSAPLPVYFEVGSILGDPELTWDGHFSAALSQRINNEFYGPFSRETAYLGFEFTADTGVHYGYALIQDGDGWGATILETGWESIPGKPILTGAIPEPGVSSLAAITGLIFLWLRRKRKPGTC
jgi:hypothetical protein